MFRLDFRYRRFIFPGYFTRTFPLHGIPPARTAFSLCLIAAMVIQPLGVLVAHGSCGDTRGYPAEFKCPSCQCCDVSSEGEPCGCCGAAADSDSCCGDSGSHAASQDDAPAVDPLFGEISSLVPVAGEERPRRISKDNDFQFTGCLCGLHSEPAIPAPVRIPTSELRESVLIVFLSDSDLAGHVFGVLPRSGSEIGTVPSTPHFSQRHLCVWRL